jgi:hypothetical protein
MRITTEQRKIAALVIKEALYSIVGESASKWIPAADIYNTFKDKPYCGALIGAQFYEDMADPWTLLATGINFVTRLTKPIETGVNALKNKPTDSLLKRLM